MSNENVKTFRAEAASRNPVEALKKIEKKIKQQIEIWRNHRFVEDKDEQPKSEILH